MKLKKILSKIFLQRMEYLDVLEGRYVDEMRVKPIWLFIALIILFTIVGITTSGCSRNPKEYCLKCTEEFYRDESLGKITTDGYLYETILIESHTTIECSDEYIGPYTINGQAHRPDNGEDFNWSCKKCVE